MTSQMAALSDKEQDRVRVLEEIACTVYTFDKDGLHATKVDLKDAQAQRMNAACRLHELEMDKARLRQRLDEERRDLRDVAALAALHALLAREPCGSHTPDSFAIDRAFALADNFVAQRSKKDAPNAG